MKERVLEAPVFSLSRSDGRRNEKVARQKGRCGKKCPLGGSLISGVCAKAGRPLHHPADAPPLRGREENQSQLDCSVAALLAMTKGRDGQLPALPASLQTAKSAPPHPKAHTMRTRLNICRQKQRFPAEADAITAAQTATIDLRPYRCDRCRQYHLTSRTKGKRRLPAAG